MTRKEEIEKVAKQIANSYSVNWGITLCLVEAATKGAEWADQHPDYSLTERLKLEKEEWLDKACEWLKENVTYTHPRKGTKECIVNITAFRDAMGG